MPRPTSYPDADTDERYEPPPDGSLDDAGTRERQHTVYHILLAYFGKGAGSCDLRCEAPPAGSHDDEKRPDRMRAIHQGLIAYFRSVDWLEARRRKQPGYRTSNTSSPISTTP